MKQKPHSTLFSSLVQIFQRLSVNSARQKRQKQPQLTTHIKSNNVKSHLSDSKPAHVGARNANVKPRRRAF